MKLREQVVLACAAGSLAALWLRRRREKRRRAYEEYTRVVEAVFKWPARRFRSEEEIAQATRRRRELFRALLATRGLGWKPFIIHVAGTKGKGSVAELLRQALLQGRDPAADPRRPVVGVFTSPHLHRPEERIRVDGACISREAFVEAARAILRDFAHIDWILPFDRLLGMALCHFARLRPQVIILEVGIGGLHDSTNFTEETDVCFITKIGLDHTELLGTEPAAIARQKAGIIKAGARVFALGGQEDSVMEAIRASARERGAARLQEVTFDERCHFGDEQNVSCTVREEAAPAAPATPAAAESAEVLFESSGEREWHAEFHRHNVEMALRDPLCSFHPENVMLVAKALEELRFPFNACFPKALSPLPCRFETFTLRSGLVVVLDGAHNPLSCGGLRKRVLRAFPGGRLRCLFFGSARDKDAAGMLQELLSPAAPAAASGGSAPGEGGFQRRRGSLTFSAFDSVALVPTPHPRATFEPAELRRKLPPSVLCHVSNGEIHLDVPPKNVTNSPAKLFAEFERAMLFVQQRTATSAEKLDPPVVVVTGSFYLAACIRAELLRRLPSAEA